VKKFLQKWLDIKPATVDIEKEVNVVISGALTRGLFGDEFTDWYKPGSVERQQVTKIQRALKEGARVEARKLFQEFKREELDMEEFIDSVVERILKKQVMK